MKIENLVIGTSGVAVSEVVATIEPPTSTDVGEIIKILVQIVIGVATLFGLFKKTPKTN